MINIIEIGISIIKELINDFLELISMIFGYNPNDENEIEGEE